MSSDDRGPVRADLHVNADDRLAYVACRVKAGVAQSHAKLVFRLGVKAAVALEASGVFRELALFAGVNFRMDF